MRALKHVCVLSTYSKLTFEQLNPRFCHHVHKCAIKSIPNRINNESSCLNHNWMFYRNIHSSCRLKGMDISSVQLAGHNTRYNPDWDLHECRFTSNISPKAPDGIEFMVRYIDTAASLDPVERDKMPVVVATHGSPGSYKDLVLVVEPLIDKGARLILPNMPGFDYTQFVKKEDKLRFTHTTGERLDFVENFLRTINVNQVDFVCGHSAGCYPITVLASKWTGVKAAALVSPAPGHTYPRAAEPWLLTCSVDWLIQTPFTRTFGLWLLGAIGTIVSGIPAKNIDHMVAVLQNATGITFEQVIKAVDALAARNFPLVFFFCEKDPIVRSKSSEEHARRLKVYTTHTYTEDGTAQGVHRDAEYDENSLSKALRFIKRSHYPQKDPRLLEIIKEEVTQLYVNTVGEH